MEPMGIQNHGAGVCPLISVRFGKPWPKISDFQGFPWNTRTKTRSVHGSGQASSQRLKSRCFLRPLNTTPRDPDGCFFGCFLWKQRKLNPKCCLVVFFVPALLRLKMSGGKTCCHFHHLKVFFIFDQAVVVFFRGKSNNKILYTCSLQDFLWPILVFYSISRRLRSESVWNHQKFQVPKMQVLNLIIRLFWGWVFPYINLT